MLLAVNVPLGDVAALSDAVTAVLVQKANASE
jgi:hypothetical protein